MNDGTVKEELGGMKDRVVGAAKDAAGALTDDPALELEGEAQNALGNARQAANDVVDDDTFGDGKGGEGTLSEEAGAIKDRVVGNVKDAAGYVAGDEELQAEGKRQAAEGVERQVKNDVV